MYICNNCGRTFNEPEIYFERHGPDSPPYEEFGMCPGCECGDFEEAEYCIHCEKWLLDEEIYAGVCKKCAYELGEDYDVLKKYLVANRLTEEFYIEYALDSHVTSASDELIVLAIREFERAYQNPLTREEQIEKIDWYLDNNWMDFAGWISWKEGKDGELFSKTKRHQCQRTH